MIGAGPRGKSSPRLPAVLSLFRGTQDRCGLAEEASLPYPLITATATDEFKVELVLRPLDKLRRFRKNLAQDIRDLLQLSGACDQGWRQLDNRGTTVIRSTDEAFVEQPG